MTPPHARTHQLQPYLWNRHSDDGPSQACSVVIQVCLGPSLWLPWSDLHQSPSCSVVELRASTHLETRRTGWQQHGIARAHRHVLDELVTSRDSRSVVHGSSPALNTVTSPRSCHYRRSRKRTPPRLSPHGTKSATDWRPAHCEISLASPSGICRTGSSSLRRIPREAMGENGHAGLT